MSDLGTLVARKLDRVGAPSFSYEDVLRRRDRKVRNQRVAAAVVGLTVFAAAAIWFGTTSRQAERPAHEVPTKAEYVHQADQICLAAAEEFKSTHLPLRHDAPLLEKAKYYRDGLVIFTDMNADLRALMSPAGSEAQVTRMLAAHSRFLDAVARAVSAAEHGNRQVFRRGIQRAFGPLAAKARVEFDAFSSFYWACPGVS